MHGEWENAPKNSYLAKIQEYGFSLNILPF